MAVNEPVRVRPTNNVYTALLAVATVISLCGLIALLMRTRELFPNENMFQF